MTTQLPRSPQTQFPMPPQGANGLYASPRPANVGPVEATRGQFYWLCFLVFSFFYELPLVELTSMHRVNPRLFDIATIIGVMCIFPTLNQPSRQPKLFKIWTKLVIWFTFCAVIWMAWLPWEEAAKFSIFYSLKYLQGVFVVYLVTRIRISSEQKLKLMYCVLLGGIVVALYAIPEYREGATKRDIGGGKVVHRAPGTVFSCLGPSYGHVGSISPLALCVCLSMLLVSKRCWTLLVLGAFLAWPSMVCGSRSGLFSIILAYGFGFLFINRLKAYSIVGGAFLVMVLFSGVIEIPSVEKLKDSSRSISRTLETEENATHNTIAGRIFFTDSYDLSLYSWQGARLPIIGGGFYAVPHTINGQLNYRIAYGVHNGYAFAFEQGGIVALIFLMFFLWYCFRDLRRAQKSKNLVDKAFATAVLMFFIISLLRSLVSNIFWLGNGMEHFSILMLLMYVLSSTPTVSRNYVMPQPSTLHPAMGRFPAPVRQ